MSRLLLIEDDLNKAKHIAATVQETFEDVQIVERHSYQSGLKEARAGGYDVIVLDMSMPTFDVGVGEEGGRSRTFAGRQILRKLQRARVDAKVVIVTQFETFIEGTEEMTLKELKRSLKENFPAIYVDTIFYQASGSVWVKELTSVLEDEMGMRRRTK